MWCQNRNPIRWSRETFGSELTLGYPGTQGCRNMGVRAVRRGCRAAEKINLKAPHTTTTTTHTFIPWYTLYFWTNLFPVLYSSPLKAHTRTLLVACTPEWILLAFLTGGTDRISWRMKPPIYTRITLSYTLSCKYACESLLSHAQCSPEWRKLRPTFSACMLEPLKSKNWRSPESVSITPSFNMYAIEQSIVVCL